MTIGTKPAADVIVDPSLVRALLEEQHPDLAHLVPVKVAEGSDNFLFRLGDELAVRLPRRAASAMPLFSTSNGGCLSCPRDCPCRCPYLFVSGFPAPCSAGRGPSSDGFLVRVSCMSPCRTRSQQAQCWERFLRALHQPAPADALLQSVARCAARGAHRRIAQASPAARRNREPSGPGAQPVGPRAVDAAVVRTSARFSTEIFIQATCW